MSRIKKSLAVLSSVCLLMGGCGEMSVLKNETPEETSSLIEMQTQDKQTAEMVPAQSEPAVIPVSAVPNEVSVGDDQPVSRALVAKMLTMTFNDLNQIETLDREISFGDTSIEKWYDKYINAAFVDGFMEGVEGNFLPEQPITLSQAQSLFDKLDSQNKIKLKLTAETKDKPISYALWINLYEKFLVNLSGDKTVKDVFNVEEKKFVVLATPGNNSQLKNWNMITDRGPLTYTGLNMDSYIDKEICVFQKDKDIIAVLSVENETPTITNAYVVKADSSAVTIFAGGAERTYNYENSLTGVSGKLCDMTINSGNGLEIKIYGEKTNDILKKTTTADIEFKNKGVMSIDENFKIYSIADGAVKWKTIHDLTIGTDIADLFIKDGKIIGAVIMKKPDADKLWVAINTTDFGSLYHGQITLTGTTDYNLTAGPEIKNYKAGEEVSISDDMFLGQRRIYIVPSTPDGRIQITSISRNWPGNERPKYRGIIEIAKDEKGYTIVNEISMEEYLYSVVPSEMPSGYGVEASKVQAVTARSYAFNQFFTNRYHSYGANIDDSVSCQVYNNIPENDTSIQAVNETKGQCLTYSGEVISANFFSTSSGVTANGGEVWADTVTKQFPTKTKEYLKSTKQYSGNDYGDLSLEENAAKFFKATDVESYDNKYPWFRWNVEMTAAEITASVNANIKNRYNANEPLIKTLQPGNVYRSRDIETIGDLKDLEVTKRGEGGNILEMKLTGTKADVLVSTEYNVRALIRPNQYISGGRDIITYCIDGKEMSNYSLMPSAFFVMDKTLDESGNVASVKFFGGGNGHGVGLSQNGVKGMIDTGIPFDQILKHYYQGTEVSQMY